MLKKIPVSQVRLGMHVHSLCGAWLDHPFWKTSFVIDNLADLRKFQSSGIAACWIDVGKGPDVAPGAPPVPVVAGVSTAAAGPPVPLRPTEFDEEVRRATGLIDQSKQAVAAIFSQARLGRTIDVESCLPLVDDIASSVWRNPGAMISLVRLKARDDYTCMHSVAVCALMVALARQLGADERETRVAGMAGLLHDLGKAVMPLDVLNKPGKLTDEELCIVKSHAQKGFDLLQKGGAAPEAALDVCLHHHEKVDGSGYPKGLRGEDLSTLARMGAVCDVYDAVTSDRPYKAGWEPAEAIHNMGEWRGGHFDDRVFQAFVQCLGIYPAGSLVRMHSGRLAVVVSQHERSLLTPVVKVFFSTRSHTHVPAERVDLSLPACGDRIVARESNAQWKFSHLDELWAGPETLKRLGK